MTLKRLYLCLGQWNGTVQPFLPSQQVPLRTKTIQAMHAELKTTAADIGALAEYTVACRKWQ